MRCRKTVTEKKLAANRANAKRSTGPRSERGKNNSRFNAAITGLFAKHVVIPRCDGYESEEEFAALLAGLRNELQPEGLSEEFWVAQIAEAMWKLLRAARSEKGWGRNGVRSARHPPTAGLVEPYEKALRELLSVQREIKATGTLSPETSATLPQLVDFVRKNVFFCTAKDGPNQSDIDYFLADIGYQLKFLISAVQLQTNLRNEIIDDSYAIQALPLEPVMDSILRYRKAAQKDIDWARQRFEDSQERRKNTEIAS